MLTPLTENVGRERSRDGCFAEDRNKLSTIEWLQLNNCRNDLAYASLQFAVIGDRRADRDLGRFDG